MSRRSFVNFRLLNNPKWEDRKRVKETQKKEKREEVDTEKPIAEGHRKSEDEGERGLMVMEEMAGRRNHKKGREPKCGLETFTIATRACVCTKGNMATRRRL